ncbi:MAG: hypothetical protein DDT20_00973 [Firmicutes bacterium]|nr:hypothetical protein [Bacillota bacterium]
MEVVSIGTTAPTYLLREILTQKLQCLVDEGVTVEVLETRGRSVNSISVMVDVAPESSFSFSELNHLGRQCTSAALADFLVEDWCQRKLAEIIQRDFGYFSAEERHKIELVTERLLQTGGLRWSKLKDTIEEFLAYNRHINADGFLRFRMQHRLPELVETVSEAVDEFLVAKEYTEFIRLLRYFVDIQQPKLPLVHLVLTSEGRYSVCGADGESVKHESFERFSREEECESDVTYEDLLISALITLSPARLILHAKCLQGGRELKDTIRNIFEGRLIECDLCEMCNSVRPTQGAVEP